MKEETITAVVSSAALSFPGAMEGGDASPVAEFTHYRIRREGVDTTHSLLCVERRAQCRADDEDSHTPSPINPLEMFV